MAEFGTHLKYYAIAVALSLVCLAPWYPWHLRAAYSRRSSQPRCSCVGVEEKSCGPPIKRQEMSSKWRGHGITRDHWKEVRTRYAIRKAIKKAAAKFSRQWASGRGDVLLVDADGIGEVACNCQPSRVPYTS